VRGPKHRKIAVFKEGLKRQNRFIGSFFRVQSIGVALVDPFFMDRAHHCPFPSSEKECFQVAEGIFDVMAVFNATNEYVLYYHSGRKTIR
jgi:hypothetical protein